MPMSREQRLLNDLIKDLEDYRERWQSGHEILKDVKMICEDTIERINYQQEKSNEERTHSASDTQA